MVGQESRSVKGMPEKTTASMKTADDFGFNITDQALGVVEFNVQSDGAAFGVADNSTLTVMQMLQAANSKSKNDVLYNGVSSLLSKAYDMFRIINTSGGIV
jgi:hypothetical protein